MRLFTQISVPTSTNVRTLKHRLQEEDDEDNESTSASAAVVVSGNPTPQSTVSHASRLLSLF